MNMNKMLRDFIAIRSVTCCYDNKTTFITSVAAAFLCSSTSACTSRGVGNVFPSEVKGLLKGVFYIESNKLKGWKIKLMESKSFIHFMYQDITIRSDYS